MIISSYSIYCADERKRDERKRKANMTFVHSFILFVFSFFPFDDWFIFIYFTKNIQRFTFFFIFSFFFFAVSEALFPSLESFPLLFSVILLFFSPLSLPMTRKRKKPKAFHLLSTYQQILLSIPVVVVLDFVSQRKKPFLSLLGCWGFSPPIC